MKILPATPTELPTAIGRASDRLKILGEKVLKQLGTQAVNATITAASVALWHQVGDHVLAAANLIAEWIKVLMHIS